MTKLKRTSGEIIASQIANMPNNNLRYGYITIETPDSKYVKLKVDAMTKYETLDRGEKVTVEYEVSKNTDIFSAKKILRKMR